MSNSSVTLNGRLPLPTNIPIVSVTLNLTQDDIDGLFQLCAHIGGEPAGIRGMFDRIRIALRPVANVDREQLLVTEDGISFGA